jgi:hypothetical protein
MIIQMKMKCLFPLVTIMLLSAHCLIAQGNDSLKTRAIQFSFITPVGTNGLSSWDVSNCFSINLLTGYAGGLSGAEFSGLFSLIRNRMQGVQFSGLGNVVLGEIRGAQFSGLFNINLKQVSAWQFAGLCNIATGSLKGFQCSGFANVATSTQTGMLLTGFVNIAAKESRGMHVSGFMNYSEGGKVTQLSGFANIVTKKTKGMQMAGFFNYAGKLKGVQIAPFNYTDSLEKGVPIGFLSFVKNGYRTLEFSATETMYGVVSFKTGVRQFYNILSTGIGYRNNRILWGWGYGLGGIIPLSEKWSLSLEGLCYQMNEGEWFTNRLNLLNKINITASWRAAKHLEIFGGLSWNVTVSDVTDEYGDRIEAHIAPWWVFNEMYDGRINVKMYPGIIAGIRI